MSDPAGMVALGFIIGLTGALAPGPTLVAAINASVKGGWTAGPKVVLGHIFVEIMMIALIAGGLSVVMHGYSSYIAIIGGAALIVFGILTILGARQARIDLLSEQPQHAEPVIAGLVTSVSNPYFWIWWLTLGSALLLGALEGGLILMIAFIAGHWGADISWYTLVSAGIHKGRFFLQQRKYRIVLAACGVFLIAFGGYYIVSAVP
ncbi:MAG: LysE type translocator [Methanoregula sp. PtaU1.Bin051]|nr:MAG: LysE type translocator [Methanoregula sp. PtaU1.Bin051]